MLPILLFEVAWKLLWLGAVAVPLWLDDRRGRHPRTGRRDPLVGIIIAVIPWRHVVAQYVTAPGPRHGAETDRNIRHIQAVWRVSDTWTRAHLAVEETMWTSRCGRRS
jgi:hypothetical protein